LDKITPKLNPMRLPNQSNLTPSTLKAQERAGITEDKGDKNPGGTLFNPSITIKTNLADCFRIFVDPKKVMNDPAEHQPRPQGENFKDNEIKVYTDGSCINNGKLNTQMQSRHMDRREPPTE
jgi:hypothetical protein